MGNKKSKTKERLVGTIFKVFTPHKVQVKLEVVKRDNCSGCFFSNYCLHYYHDIIISTCGYCSKHERSDGESIIYKKIE